MIEITTSNSINVNELLFAFGNLRDEVMFITMTTPTLIPFHQKIFAHAKSGKCDRFSAFSIFKFRIPHFESPRESDKTSNRGAGNQDRRGQVQRGQFPNQIPPFRLYPDSVGALRPLREQSAFTLIELLAVITIIGILAGLTLGAAGAVRRHGATSTAKAEVAALQAACDRYYADNNAYPTNSSSDNIGCDPTSSFVPTATSYTKAGTVLFTNLIGGSNLTIAPTSKRYFEPKPSMVNTNGYFIDPWGYAYGYNSDGINAPLIWSTAGQTTANGINKWITSWPKM
jgi:prepilin-type N-terminal cleavage/methylation domain-containing protein